MLRQEFSVGKRLGEPVAHRIRGRPAEPRHDELEFPVARVPLCVCQFMQEIMRHLLMRNY